MRSAEIKVKIDSSAIEQTRRVFVRAFASEVLALWPEDACRGDHKHQRSGRCRNCGALYREHAALYMLREAADAEENRR